jgi:alpha/beta superfamily hydrolase
VASNETFDFRGPAGRLEATLANADAPPVAAAVVCHAHPLHGGMMHFKVVYRAAKALQSAGLAVLRFNFRGVGRSEGVHDHGAGEQEDARAALLEMRDRFPGLPLVLGGFSFGSAVSLGLAPREPLVKAVIAMGYPLRTADQFSGASPLRTADQFSGASPLRMADRFSGASPLPSAGDAAALAAVRQPRLFVQGEHDEFGSGEALRAQVRTLPPPSEVVVIPAADHYFTGQLDALQGAIADWAGRRPWDVAVLP